MFCDQLHGAGTVDFAPHFVGGDSAKSACWNLDAEIEQSFMADIYDYRLRSTRGPSGNVRLPRSRLLRRWDRPIRTGVRSVGDRETAPGTRRDERHACHPPPHEFHRQ